MSQSTPKPDPITTMEQYDAKFPKIRELGSGGFGSVDLRREAATGRLIASKVIQHMAERAPREKAALGAFQGNRHVMHAAGPHHLRLIKDLPRPGEAILHLEFCDLGSLQAANGGWKFARGKLPLALVWKLCRDLVVVETPDFPFVNFKLGDLGHAEDVADITYPLADIMSYDITRLGELFTKQMPDCEATEGNGLDQLREIIASMKARESSSIVRIERVLVPIAERYVDALSHDEAEIANVQAVLTALR
ncbi:hypothetical protein K490DRAFT_64883 [Saccharata proteae CBS 121410]|uniref:Protein kinase domain-containing protein n=1 Tax=Saccharata proteae CBS 121410 TaxID=1314787 RepID=A0A9P4HZR9_9PEZI|nr:hypothetical protein K490DRAFT_64883 [Saccharata proteae CBS 121410]